MQRMSRSAMLLFAMLLFIVSRSSNPMSLFAQNPTSKTPAPQQVEVPGFTVIGFAIRTTNAQEMSGSEGKIGPLWNRFMHGGEEAIPGVKEPGTIYAVYTHYESDETGAYDLILGKSVQPDQQVPAGMKSIHIPASRYLVFPLANNSPTTIKTAWINIDAFFRHHTHERRAFTADFEQYSSLGARIFIAVR